MRLILFDVDGTLIDSQAAILSALQAAFAAVGRAMPPRGVALSIVGLSLPLALARLAPEADDATLQRMVAAYTEAYHRQRISGGADDAPFYPGMRALLDRWAARDDVLLGVATGKSRRGMRGLITAHGLERAFVTLQTADDHPSKPHPAMVFAALTECGVEPGQAVMIGDTRYDIDMARAAGVRSVGVTWGYHGQAGVEHADAVAADAAALERTVTDWMGIDA